MKKNLYVIFDCKNRNYGEVMSMENDEEAKRSFILSLISLPDVLSDDLVLYSLGSLDVVERCSFETGSEVVHCPMINVMDCSGLVCTSRDVEEEVKQYRVRNAEMSKIASEINVNYSAKKFVENVEKLSRYFAKKDKKRFNK